jgi:hypothetical protein
MKLFSCHNKDIVFRYLVCAVTQITQKLQFRTLANDRRVKRGVCVGTKRDFLGKLPKTMNCSSSIIYTDQGGCKKGNRLKNSVLVAGRRPLQIFNLNK